MSSSIQIRPFKGWKTACLDKAFRRMKKYADKGRRPMEFMVGDAKAYSGRKSVVRQWVDRTFEVFQTCRESCLSVEAAGNNRRESFTISL